MKPRTSTSLFLVLWVTLSSATMTYAVLAFWVVLNPDGLGVVEALTMLLFAVLMLWVALGFWTATFGFVRELAMLFRSKAQRRPIGQTHHAGPLPKTAVVMPIYNESPAEVFAGVRAMVEQLQMTAQARHFDFFILSDTTDPDIWLREEAFWATTRAALSGEVGLYYRHRTDNTYRKSGNIRDFCERWGSQYRYMVVLDADSLLEGPTLVEMVRRMELDPQIALVQAPPAPVNRLSFFARMQQFSARVYGQVFNSGFALWVQDDGNYWGHNAIIRIEPFMDHCGLPKLPGVPPLGGEILSHDFVEAAMLREAGWKVVLDHDLQGSYEQCPTNLIDFAKRDQRWCQGNLQHTRLAAAYGVHIISRLHLTMGVMSYASSLLWAMFLVLAVLLGIGVGQSAPGAFPLFGLERYLPITYTPGAVWLFILTMAMLMIPKAYGYIIALTQPRVLRTLGGPGRLLVSVLLETLVSVIVAPIFMAFHSTFVVGTLLGHSTHWGTQRRSETVLHFRDALSAHAMHTIVGFCALILVDQLAPQLMLWLSPVLFGLIFSVPISILLSSATVGRKLRQWGLLLIPEEYQPPDILLRQRRHAAHHYRAVQDAPHAFTRMVVDPALNRLHATMLREQHAPGGQTKLSPEMHRLRKIALAGGPAHLTQKERKLLISDAATIEWLHREAWIDWPVGLLDRVASTAHKQSALGPLTPPAPEVMTGTS